MAAAVDRYIPPGTLTRDLGISAEEVALPMGRYLLVVQFGFEIPASWTVERLAFEERDAGGSPLRIRARIFGNLTVAYKLILVAPAPRFEALSPRFQMVLETLWAKSSQ